MQQLSFLKNENAEMKTTLQYNGLAGGIHDPNGLATHLSLGSMKTIDP